MLNNAHDTLPNTLKGLNELPSWSDNTLTFDESLYRTEGEQPVWVPRVGAVGCLVCYGCGCICYMWLSGKQPYLDIPAEVKPKSRILRPAATLDAADAPFGGYNTHIRRALHICFSLRCLMCTPANEHHQKKPLQSATTANDWHVKIDLRDVKLANCLNTSIVGHHGGTSNFLLRQGNGQQQRVTPHHNYNWQTFHKNVIFNLKPNPAIIISFT